MEDKKNSESEATESNTTAVRSSSLLSKWKQIVFFYILFILLPVVIAVAVLDLKRVRPLIKEVTRLEEVVENLSNSIPNNSLSTSFLEAQRNITALSDHLNLLENQSRVKLQALEISTNLHQVWVNNTIRELNELVTHSQLQVNANTNAIVEVNETMLHLIYELEFILKEDLEKLAIASHSNFSNFAERLIHLAQETTNQFSAFDNTLANISATLTWLKLNTTAKLTDFITELGSIRQHVNTELASLNKVRDSKAEFADLQQNISDVREESHNGDAALRRYVDVKVKSEAQKVYKPHIFAIIVTSIFVCYFCYQQF